MKTIVIKSQAELDALPHSFDEYTKIEVRTDSLIRVRVNYDNATLEGYDNATLEGYDNATLVGYDNAKLYGYGNAKLYGYNNARLYGYDNATLVGYDNATLVGYDNATLVGYGNATLVGYDNAKLVGYDNAKLVGYLCSTIICHSLFVTIKKLLDNSRLIYKKEGCKRPEQIDSTAIITEYEELVEPTFEQWLDRGYVMADGILKKHKKTKQIDDGLTLYEVFNDISEKETSFVVTDGTHYSHGKTLRQAVSDLMFKKSERGASKYQGTKIDQVFKTQDAIVMYRTITGACSQGAEEFLERNFKDKEEVSVSEIIKITEGHYGHEQFKNFGWAQ